MATLPAENGLSNGVQFRQQPDLTWGIDRTGNRIRGTVAGHDAVRQAVEVILNVERFRWQIYRPYSGTQWDGLIGQDPGYVAAELQRRIDEALRMDDRIQGISEFSYTVSGDALSAEMTVQTVYGDVEASVEVTLS